MLKNKLKVIAVLLLIFLLVATPIVRAVNEGEEADTVEEATTTEQEEPVEEEPMEEETPEEEPEETVEESEIIEDEIEEEPEALDSEEFDDEENHNHQETKNEDVYLIGDDITIDYVIDGNLYVIANSVTIKSQIGGDAFILANSVKVESSGYIFSNLFTATKDLTIDGIAYDVYAVADNISISGFIYRDVKATCSCINILGNINRNAFLSCSNINFTSQEDDEDAGLTGTISGNLTYSSSKELSFPEGSVGGETIYSAFEVKATDAIQENLLNLGGFVLAAIAIWLVCLWLAPKFLSNTNELIANKKLPIILFGLLTPIAVTLVSVILFIIGITFKLAILAIAVLLILIYLGLFIFIICANNMICSKLKIEKNLQKFGLLVATSIVVWLINLIPFIGTLLVSIAKLLGIGIIVSSIVPLKKKENNNAV